MKRNDVANDHQTKTSLDNFNILSLINSIMHSTFLITLSFTLCPHTSSIGLTVNKLPVESAKLTENISQQNQKLKQTAVPL